jgi:hypothetical protein
MNLDALVANWALWAAVVPAAIAALFIGRILYGRSARGQLNAALRDHRDATRALEKASRSVRSLEKRLQKLESKAAKVKPRALQEAKDALDDARALSRILDDKAQVTRNLVRRAIFEEFPPSAHEKMRARYLPEDVDSGRPFTIER